MNATLQPWPWPERPRVLIEDADGERALSTATALRSAGYTVGICGGPTDSAPCPLAEGEDCPFVDGADVIVCALAPDTRAGRDVLHALRLRRPSRPLVIATGHDDEAGRRRLVATVRDELARCEA
jgi:CheY-like chemotaxis protein